ncbi:hypothetical protein AB6A40_003923 [Gnathostoma spinigerum]|uniref:Uncharacterized protein n=1 Tax=Gnathostoma spinigerum TaxID=75299 RepID=A0ABD6EGF5_9BILA
MSTVAASSSQIVSRVNGNVVSQPKRNVGTFRVVADDCAQFSIEEDFDDDDADTIPVLGVHERDSFPEVNKTNRPFMSYNYNEDNLMDRKKDASRTPARGLEKEMSRLTDEVEIDGDSASDDLDLLPPLPQNSRKIPKIKFPDWLCCRSRIPMKCTIM